MISNGAINGVMRAAAEAIRFMPLELQQKQWDYMKLALEDLLISSEQYDEHLRRHMENLTHVGCMDVCELLT